MRIEEGMIIRLKDMRGKLEEGEARLDTGENIILQTEDHSGVIILDQSDPAVMHINISFKKILLGLYEPDFNLLIKVMQENIGEQQMLFDIPNDP